MTKLFSAVLSAAIAFAACGVSSQAAPTDRTLRIAYQADISNFDPDGSFQTFALSAIGAVYEGLVEYAPGSTKVVGRLAKSWIVSPDGMTYTFTLRDGVTFHDGKPMTSAEVKASFERRKNKQLVLWYFLANVKEMTAPDPSTFVLALGHPQASLLDNLASPWGPKVISPSVLAEHGGSDLAKSWLNTHAIGTGPFELAEFTPGQKYVLKRFDKYWGEKPHFQTIDIAVLPDIGQQILKLRGGELDAIPNGYPTAQLAKVPTGFQVASNANLAMILGFFHPRMVARPELMTAIKTALNPKLWLSDVFGDYAVPAQSLYPSAMLTPKDPIVFPTDVDAAKKVVAAAGPVSMTIAFTTDKAVTVRVPADLMIAQLATIGITATASAVPTGAPYGFAKNLDAAPDLFLTRVNPDAAHPEAQAEPFFTKGGAVNYYQYTDPESGKLVAEAAPIASRAEADLLYEKAGRIVFEAGGVVPFAELKETIVFRNGLKDVITRPAFPPGNIDFALISE